VSVFFAADHLADDGWPSVDPVDNGRALVTEWEAFDSKINRKQLTRSPTHLDCTIQPNSYDCGYQAVLNAFSISDHIINTGTDDDGGNLIANTDLTT
jgi:hypothetical protein